MNAAVIVLLLVVGTGRVEQADGTGRNRIAPGQVSCLAVDAAHDGVDGGEGGDEVGQQAALDHRR